MLKEGQAPLRSSYQENKMEKQQKRTDADIKDLIVALLETKMKHYTKLTLQAWYESLKGCPLPYLRQVIINAIRSDAEFINSGQIYQAAMKLQLTTHKFFMKQLAFKLTLDPPKMFPDKYTEDEMAVLKKSEMDQFDGIWKNIKERDGIVDTLAHAKVEIENERSIRQLR